MNSSLGIDNGSAATDLLEELTVMLEDKNKVLPKNHPVSFALYDPQYQLVTKRTISKNLNGLYDFVLDKNYFQ